jgi:hypothetical protein
MQAGLTTRRLTLREIFPSAMMLWVSKRVAFGQPTTLVIVNGTPSRWRRITSEPAVQIPQRRRVRPTRHPNEVLPKERIIQAVWPVLSEPTPSGSSFLSFCSFASGKVEPVVEVGRPTAGLSATRDGRSVLFAQVDQEGSDLMLLENFLHWPKGTARAVAGRVLQ